MAEVDLRVDSDEILRWHNAQHNIDAIVESKSFFLALGLELEVIDITSVRGGEILLDLNEACDTSLHGRYAVIIDGGTIEHCFNIAQAAKNILNMTRKGGHILSVNPLNMFNHGFYNINPTWYHDFYHQNGCTIISLSLIRLGDNHSFSQVPMTDRFSQAPTNSMLVLHAVKSTEQNITWPTQTKYIVNPLLVA